MAQDIPLLTFRPATAACQHQLQGAPGLPFADHLPAATVHAALRALGGAFRHALSTPAVTLWTFLSQLLDPDHSCRQAVARLLAWRTAQGLPPCAPQNSAYCKARGRLPEALLARLTRDTGRAALDRADPAWLWRGRPVKLVDGTCLSMPDTPKNQAAYPQTRRQQPGLGFPILRLVVLFSLAVGTALDAAFGPYRGKGTGELSLFRRLREQLAPDDVLVADRYYCTYWEVAAARACGADVVLRRHDRAALDFAAGAGRGPQDRLACWRRPRRPDWMTEEEYKKIPECMMVRAVEVGVRQRGFRVRQFVVLTTLLDPAGAARGELADLYRARWQAELDLRSLKVTLQMNILRGQSPAMVGKEVWGHLLAYNVVRTLMAQAARGAGLAPRQVSFTGAVQTLNAFWPLVRGASPAAALRLWVVMIWAMGRHEVADRPDRYEPRQRKRQPQRYPFLHEPRAEARKRLAERA
jgi:Transposase DDE domain